MPWTPPSDPVTSTVITVAYAVANLLTQVRWLRLMTGNADPPGSNYVALSDTPSTTSWRKLPADAILDGAITDAKMLTPKVNRGGDAMTGDLNISRGGGADGYLTLGAGTAHYLGWDGGKFTFSGHPVQVPGYLTAAAGLTSIGDIMAYRGAGTTGYVVLGNNPQFFIGWDGADIVTHTGKVWTSGNDGPTSGLQAQSAETATQATNAASVGNRTPTATATPNAIPISDPNGKLDAWVTPASFSIPSGLGCWVRQASEIPAGFAREASLDGLMLIGAGTSFSQTFTEQTTYGTTWQHTHTDSGHAHGSTAHTHGASALGVAGNVAASSSALNGRFTAGGANALPDNHIHDSGTLDVTGSTDGTSLTTNNGSAVIGTTTWLPPMRAVVWARKT